MTCFSQWDVVEVTGFPTSQEAVQPSLLLLLLLEVRTPWTMRWAAGG